MKVKVLWLISAILVFLFFVIAKMPAQQVIGRMDLGSDVAIYDVDGTIWSGEITRLSVQGFTIENFTWDINPFALLLATISADINGGNMRDSDDIAIDGKIKLSLFNLQSIRSDALLVYVPTDRVLAEVALPIPVKAGGRFRLRFEQLEYGPTCSVMQGWGDWLNASVGGTRGPVTLGNFSAKLSCENEQIKMLVEEPNTLGLSFVSRVSADFASFRVEGKFKPDDSLPSEVHQAARFFGTPDNQGYTSFRF